MRGAGGNPAGGTGKRSAARAVAARQHADHRIPAGQRRIQRRAHLQPRQQLRRHQRLARGVLDLERLARPQLREERERVEGRPQLLQLGRHLGSRAGIGRQARPPFVVPEEHARPVAADGLHQVRRHPLQEVGGVQVRADDFRDALQCRRDLGLRPVTRTLAKRIEAIAVQEIRRHHARYDTVAEQHRPVRCTAVRRQARRHDPVDDERKAAHHRLPPRSPGEKHHLPEQQARVAGGQPFALDRHGSRIERHHRKDEADEPRTDAHRMRPYPPPTREQQRDGTELADEHPGHERPALRKGALSKHGRPHEEGE